MLALIVLLLAGAAPVSAQKSAPESNSDRVTATREAISKWVETQRIASREAAEWRLGKETLLARMDVVTREIDSLKKRTADAEASLADTDKKRAELAEESEQRKATARGLEERIQGLEQRVLKMLPRLPEPLRERIKPLSQRLPPTAEAAAETRLSLSERYQNVIGILNEIGKWNREVSVVMEVRTLADGTNIEVSALYIGLGQAYYVGTNGKVAGTGAATADGWVWKPADHLADAVAAAVAVYRNERLAQLVRLPVQIL